MSIFKDRIWSEILEGKRQWNVPEHTPAACDLFELEVVIPLRDLVKEGKIEEVEEVEAPVPGQYRVKAVFLKGIVRSDLE